MKDDAEAEIEKINDKAAAERKVINDRAAAERKIVKDKLNAELKKFNEEVDAEIGKIDDILFKRRMGTVAKIYEVAKSSVTNSSSSIWGTPNKK